MQPATIPGKARGMRDGSRPKQLPWVTDTAPPAYSLDQNFLNKPSKATPQKAAPA